MFTKSILTFLAASITLSNAQISSGPDDTVTCTGGGNAYCAEASLSTNIIIRCSGTKGQPGNCNDNLAFIPPVGVKTDALCYQTSPTSGDAACSFNGIVYPDTGPPFPINNGTNATSSFSTSASIPTAPGPVVPITMTIASIPTAPGLPTGLSTSGMPTPRGLSTISTGGYIPYSSGGAPYPITSTKTMTAPTVGTGVGATGGSSGVAAGATTDPDPSTSPISSSGGVMVMVQTSIEMVLLGVVVSMVMVWWM